jgi:tetratricopeptide (TPR) repeat protein
MTLGDMDEADILLKQAEEEAGREQPLPMAARVVWNTMAGRPEAAYELARYIISNGLPDRWGSDAIVFHILHNQALSTGNLDDALAAFQKRHPSLFTATPEIKVENILQAVDLSSLLQASGQNEQAETLLEAILAAYDQPYFATGGYALWIVPAKAEALVLLGRQDEAIAELQRIVDKGWRITWQWDTELNPIFDSLRNDPRYLDIINFLQQDMERQKQEWAKRERADVA